VQQNEELEGVNGVQSPFQHARYEHHFVEVSVYQRVSHPQGTHHIKMNVSSLLGSRSHTAPPYKGHIGSLFVNMARLLSIVLTALVACSVTAAEDLSNCGAGGMYYLSQVHSSHKFS
jgi:hypothetical protein